MQEVNGADGQGNKWTRTLHRAKNTAHCSISYTSAVLLSSRALALLTAAENEL